MILFKDTSGLKVVSVGLLLGMVSCLQGNPMNQLSFSVQGDKVVLYYSGPMSEFDASAFPFFEAANCFEQGIVVVDDCSELACNINHSSVFNYSNAGSDSSITAFLNRLLLNASAVRTDFSHQPFQPVFAVEQGCDEIKTSPVFIACAVPDNQKLDLWRFSKAHATRAGPLA
jgi:hypothetical protein